MVLGGKGGGQYLGQIFLLKFVKFEGFYKMCLVLLPVNPWFLLHTYLSFALPTKRTLSLAKVASTKMPCIVLASIAVIKQNDKGIL